MSVYRSHLRDEDDGGYDWIDAALAGGILLSGSGIFGMMVVVVAGVFG